MKVLFLLIALFPVSVHAQMDEKTLGEVQKMIAGQVQRHYWEIARGYQGEKLAPPEGEQGAVYQIPEEEEKYAVMAGMNSAKFAWCGLDVEGYIKAFMQRQGGRGLWSVYQMAYISLLQSSAQGFMQHTLEKEKLKCSDPVKREVQEGYEKAIEQWEKDAKSDHEKTAN